MEGKFRTGQRRATGADWAQPATEMEIFLLALATANTAAIGAICDSLVRRGLLGPNDIRRVHREMSAAVQREEGMVSPQLVVMSETAIDHVLAPVLREARERDPSE